MRYSVILTVILALLKFPSLAQQPENKYDHFLDSLSVSVPALNQQVDISVSDISIKELIRMLGNSTGLNVSVDPTFDRPVNSNFVGVTAKDVINFLCFNYNLKPDIYGQICQWIQKLHSWITLQ